MWAIHSRILVFSLIGLILGTLYLLLVEQGCAAHCRKETFYNHNLLPFEFVCPDACNDRRNGPDQLAFCAHFYFIQLAQARFWLIAYFITAMVLLSVINPLNFASHAVVVLGQNAFQAISSSFKNEPTFLFHASIFLTFEVIIAFLTNMLCKTPADNSPCLLSVFLGTPW
jgi:hypothetical protein